MAAGDRFVRRHNAARTSTSNTTAADISYDTAVISDGTNYTWSSPEVTVSEAGKYLCIFDIGEVQLSGNDRAVGTLVPSVNTTDQTLYKARSRYLRDSGGNHGASFGQCILDLAVNDDVKIRNPGAITGTDAVLNYATNSGQGGGFQLIHLGDGSLTEVQRTTSQSPITVTTAYATAPWLDSTLSTTQITFTSEVVDDDGLYPGTGGDLTLAANTKYLICYGATLDGSSGERHTHHLQLEINGNNVQHSTGYERNNSSDGPPMQGMYLHETGGTSETLRLNAGVEQEDSGVSNTVGCDNAYVQIYTLPSSAEWIHVDNGATNSLDTALAGTSTYYDVPLSSTLRADGDSNLSLDSANDAVQNDSGASMPVLAIGWNMWDRDNNTSTVRKHVWSYWDNGGTRIAYGISGGYNRGDQGNDGTRRLGFVSAATMDLANAADLTMQVRDPVNATNQNMGIYASTSRYFLGVQVLNLDTLSAAASTTMVADTGSYSITGQAIDVAESMVADTGSYAITGVEISVEAPGEKSIQQHTILGRHLLPFQTYPAGAASTTLIANTGSYTITGQDADLDLTMPADTGSYSITGSGADLDLTMPADTGSYSLTGIETTLLYSQVITAETGTYTITGIDADLDLTMPADTGSYSITGSDAELLYSEVVVADTGSYTITGIDAELLYSEVMIADTGSYSITGQDATLTQSTLMVADTGAYTLIGQDATFLYSEVVVADTGSYTITGQAAELLYSEILTADTGSYSITGSDATLTQSVLMVADTGSYAITGSDANLTINEVLVADTGSYTITGQAADFALTMPADTATYTITGQDATLLTSEQIVAETGSYSITGFDASLLYSEVLVADTGSYSITGSDATLTEVAADTMIADTGSYSITGIDADFILVEGAVDTHDGGGWVQQRKSRKKRRDRRDIRDKIEALVAEAYGEVLDEPVAEPIEELQEAAPKVEKIVQQEIERLDLAQIQARQDRMAATIGEISIIKEEISQYIENQRQYRQKKLEEEAAILLLLD